jgi:8-oxo-dGTP pyrophosphatase MutT (NUDIX family)
VKWTVHGRRAVYESPWVSVWLDDVELPDGQRYEHHVVRVPKVGVNVVLVDDDYRVLMIWRHRFIVNQWVWEVPSGWIDDGEEPEDTARREVEEETGWRPKELVKLGSCNADNGLVSLRSHLYLARGGTYQGPPTDTTEADRVEWIPLADIPALLHTGQVSDAPVMTALLLTLLHVGTVQ